MGIPVRSLRENDRLLMDFYPVNRLSAIITRDLRITNRRGDAAASSHTAGRRERAVARQIRTARNTGAARVGAGGICGSNRSRALRQWVSRSSNSMPKPCRL